MKKALLLLTTVSVLALTALQLHAAPTLQECRDLCAPKQTNCLVYGGDPWDCRVLFTECLGACLEGI